MGRFPIIKSSNLGKVEVPGSNPGNSSNKKTADIFQLFFKL